MHWWSVSWSSDRWSRLLDHERSVTSRTSTIISTNDESLLILTLSSVIKTSRKLKSWAMIKQNFQSSMPQKCISAIHACILLKFALIPSAVVIMAIRKIAREKWKRRNSVRPITHTNSCTILVYVFDCPPNAWLMTPQWSLYYPTVQTKIVGSLRGLTTRFWIPDVIRKPNHGVCCRSTV